MNMTILEIDGQDKVGKDTVLRYIELLSNYKYVIKSRGILSQLVYNDKFNRQYDYSLCYKPFVVLLTADAVDLHVRHKIAKEPKSNIAKDAEAFSAYANMLRRKGIQVIEFNTSKVNAMQIAKDVIWLFESYSEKQECLVEPIALDNLHIYDDSDISDDVKYEGIKYE